MKRFLESYLSSFKFIRKYLRGFWFYDRNWYKLPDFLLTNEDFYKTYPYEDYR